MRAVREPQIPIGRAPPHSALFCPRFPPWEAFERRPPSRMAVPKAPASETLHHSSRAPEHESADLATSPVLLPPPRRRQTRASPRSSTSAVVDFDAKTARHRPPPRQMRAVREPQIPIGRAPPHSALFCPRFPPWEAFERRPPSRMAVPKAPASETLHHSCHPPRVAQAPDFRHERVCLNGRSNSGLSAPRCDRSAGAKAGRQQFRTFASGKSNSTLSWSPWLRSRLAMRGQQPAGYGRLGRGPMPGSDAVHVRAKARRRPFLPDSGNRGKFPGGKEVLMEA